MTVRTSFAKSLPPVFWVVFLTVLGATSSWASPTEVTVFPDSAMVRGETSSPVIRQDNRIFTELILPAQADPETLNISLNNEQPVSVTDMAFERAEPLETHQVAVLKEKLEGLLREKETLQISIKSAEKSAAFWENQAGFQAAQLAEMERISRTIASNLQQIYSGILEIRHELDQVNEDINDLERRIEQITGPESRVWKVRVFVDVPGNKEELSIAYSYILRNSGWKSFYRLEAWPGDEYVRFTWQAEVWQSSGTDWDEVQLTLATLEPQREIVPRPIPDWVVAPREDFFPVARTMDALATSPEAAPVPVMERIGTFSQWNIGKRNLAAGDTPRFKIQEQDWPADFTHLVRPSISDQAFIRAKVQFDVARDLPRGEAMFLLDGALLGKRPLRLVGTGETLYFGHDPFVRATLVTREKKSGVRGIFTNKQTYLWDFVVNIENNQLYPVKVRLEEPRPILRDERIKVSYDFRPDPDERTENLFIWSLAMEPGQSREVGLIISMEAPEDMDIDWGWRR